MLYLWFLINIVDTFMGTSISQHLMYYGTSNLSNLHFTSTRGYNA